MAVIIGLVNAAERAELERRGWTVERPDKFTLASLYGFHPGDFGRDEINGDQWVQVYVDADLFKIMSGHDWDQGPQEKERTHAL